MKNYIVNLKYVNRKQTIVDNIVHKVCINFENFVLIISKLFICSHCF